MNSIFLLLWLLSNDNNIYYRDISVIINNYKRLANITFKSLEYVFSINFQHLFFLPPQSFLPNTCGFLSFCNVCLCFSIFVDAFSHSHSHSFFFCNFFYLLSDSFSWQCLCHQIFPLLSFPLLVTMHICAGSPRSFFFFFALNHPPSARLQATPSFSSPFHSRPISSAFILIIPLGRVLGLVFCSCALATHAHKNELLCYIIKIAILQFSSWCF